MGEQEGKTNLRHITQFLKKVAVRSLKEHHEKIYEEDVRDTIF